MPGMTVAGDTGEAAMIEINRILCPIDFSPFSERALAYAMKIAVWYGATLRILHVMAPLPPSAPAELAAGRERTARTLLATVERFRLPGIDVETVLVESAEAAEKILECAEAFDADLVLTGSHGRSGVQRVLFGSVVEAMLHRCARPVLAIPSHLESAPAANEPTFSQILCPVDFAAASLNAVAYARSLAEESDARLTLLHVIALPPELTHAPQPPGYDVALIRAEAEAECLNKLQQLVPAQAADRCTVETAVVEGGVSRQVLRVADERRADLIVFGVDGRSAFDLAFFGSTSKDVIRQAHCPVLIVPASRRYASMLVAS
jgi:nucleotide-binding universal stress UspA family protein